MEYTPLNNQSVIDYLKNRVAVGEVLSDFDHLTAVEVGDGNLNLVFILISRVRSDSLSHNFPS